MGIRRKPYYTLILSVLCCALFHSVAQSQTQYGINDTITVPAIIYNGDTLSYKEMPEVYIYLELSAAGKRAHREWTRLRNAVYVTYPYAKKAGAVFNDIQTHLVNITDLSVYQGKVLMKLITRETGNTCYEIIHDYKGSFSASFWQSVAWIFGSSLKQTYNPRAEDAQIEDIVMEVRRMYGMY